MDSSGVQTQIDEQARIVDRWKALDASFANALQMGIHLPLALARLGVQLCTRGNDADAREVLGAAYELLPADASIAINLAVVLERLNETDEAIRYAKRSVAIDPSQVDSWIFLGNLQRKQANLPAAAASYESAIARNANSPLAWQGLGFVKKDQFKPAEALDCFITSIRQAGATAPLLSILGQLFWQTGQFEKSRDAYAAAVEFDAGNTVYRRMLRETTFINAMIEAQSIEAALETYQSDVAAQPAADDKAGPELLSSVFSLLSAYGRTEAARRVGEYRFAIDPDNASAAYMLAAVQGDATIARTPDAYLIEHFDAFSKSFDDQLTRNLDYDIPEKLGFMLANLVPSDVRLNVLDAGCGTGLCGPWLKSMAATLTGVDISQGMLDQAQKRTIYDSLIRDELTAFLQKSTDRYGLIVAADVLIYFGDLTAIVAALAHALKPDGLLAFSIECDSGASHKLLTSGRFAHDPAYVRSALYADFVEVQSEQTTVRLEALKPVPGEIFIFRKR